jgi:tetratricopeptide (TPR) repeat protein
MRKNISVGFLSVCCLVSVLPMSRAQDAKLAAESLKYSRDFYSKVHLVAIANLSLGSAGTAEFKYDRYPNGGPERIQCDDGEFARKNGKTWLKSSDWGETGKPVDAQTAKRLNNWVGLINARLNGEPASSDPSEGATVMKFVGKEDQGEREEFVFEESKEKPRASTYPRVSFGKFKNEKTDHVLLSEFSGPMRLGGHDAQVKISFSHLVAVEVQETRMVWNEKEKRYVQADDNKDAESSPPPSSPAEEDSGGELVNRGIEKAKNGDLDGAIADFNRAIEIDPKDDAPYFNRAQAKWLKKDTAGAIADYTRAIELGSTNPAAYNNRGNARAEKNDRDGAIADYTRAIELKPDYARAYYNRATVKKDKGDKKGAEADFKTAKKLDPELAREKSAADSKSNRLSPSPAPPAAKGSSADLVNRGIEKAKKGDLNAALLDFYRAIERDPKNAVAARGTIFKFAPDGKPVNYRNTRH